LIDMKNKNVLALAFIGDAVYELHVRNYLISKNIEKVNELQKESIKYVSAKNQAKFLKEMIDDNFLSEEEIDIIKRARNHKSHSSKTTDIITYKHATALEALIGYHHLENNNERIKEIISFILGE